MSTPTQNEIDEMLAQYPYNPFQADFIEVILERELKLQKENEKLKAFCASLIVKNQEAYGIWEKKREIDADLVETAKETIECYKKDKEITDKISKHYKEEYEKVVKENSQLKRKEMPTLERIAGVALKKAIDRFDRETAEYKTEEYELVKMKIKNKNKYVEKLEKEIKELKEKNEN